VAGTAFGKYDASLAFTWTAAKGRLVLGTLAGDDESSAAGINDAGEVVGTSFNTDTGSHAFLWTLSGGMQDLGSLGGNSSNAIAINNSGEVVGLSYLADNLTYHAFLWTKAGGMRDLGTLGGSDSWATAINDSGGIVGSSDDAVSSRAFVWTPTGGMQDLGALSGGYYIVGEAINASGQIFRLMKVVDLRFQPFLGRKTGESRPYTLASIAESSELTALARQWELQAERRRPFSGCLLSIRRISTKQFRQILAGFCIRLGASTTMVKLRQWEPRITTFTVPF
jgi:probable HAF family extracellular repeat protein